MATKKSKKHSEGDFGIGIIWINSGIDEDAVSDFISSFYALLGDPSVKQIMVKINSFGGSISCGIAIAEEIRLSPKTVITVAQGTVASIAVLILEAGDVRLMTKFSDILMHKPISILEGEYSGNELQQMIERSKKTEKTVLNYISGKTGRSPEEIETDIGTLKIFLAEEALKYGLIDEII